MKILKPTAYYKPEQFSSSHLNDDLEKAFADAGFEYVIIAPTPSRGVSNEVKKEYRRRLYEEKYDGKVKVYRIPMMDENGIAILRAFRYALMCLKQYRRCIKEKYVDVVYAASTPPIQGLMAARVAKKLRVPLVYNLQDVFPDSLVNAGMTRRGSLIWKLGRKIEDYTYKNADRIITISDGFKKNIKAKGVSEDKIVVIRNWIDENRVVPIPRDQNVLIQRYNLDTDKFYITYCGNIGMSQNFEMLVSAAEKLMDNKEIAFILIGEGVYKEAIQRIVVEKNLENIILLPFQPYEDISHVFSLGNVGLVISKPGIGESSVPSKALSIMAAGRPILACFDIDSELVKMIETNHCGVWNEPDDIKGFIDRCRSLCKSNDELERMSIRGRSTVCSEYSKSLGTKSYIDVLKNIE